MDRKLPKDAHSRTDIYLLTLDNDVNIKLRKEEKFEIKLKTPKHKKYPYVESWQKIFFDSTDVTKDTAQLIANECKHTKNKIDGIWAEVKVVKKVIKTHVELNEIKGQFLDQMNECISKKKLSMVSRVLDVEVRFF